MDQELLKARRERRHQFLQVLYDEVDGDVAQFVDGFEIAAKSGAGTNEARRIIAYFEEKRLILVDDHKSGIIRITAAGVDAVESDAR